MISQTAEYALRAMVHLAQNPGSPAAAQEVSRSTKVPVGYLQKVLRQLARAGIVNAQRGSGGGFSLAKVATAISVLEVLKATDSAVLRIERCPLGIEGHSSLCALHRMLDEQAANTERVFASTSIADLLAANDNARALCEVPAGQPLSVRGQSPRTNGASPPPKQ